MRMKILKELAIIIGITLVGELLNKCLPLPVPAGVYGMFLLLLLLCIGVVKVEHVETTVGFVLEIMPILFIPATVGLMDSYAEAKEILVPMVVISVVSTVVVLVTTGKVAEGILSMGKKQGKAGAAGKEER